MSVWEKRMPDGSLIAVFVDSSSEVRSVSDGTGVDFDRAEPYEVACARCGKVLSSDEAYVEEADEWECPECWERCEAAERNS
jgi:DNA-directed RNA polymerase subunit RPC12/RpoP